MLTKRLFLFIFFSLAGALGFGELTGKLTLFWDVRLSSQLEKTQYADVIARSGVITLQRLGLTPISGGPLEDLLPGVDRGAPLAAASLKVLAAAAREQGSSFFIIISYFIEKDGVNQYLEARAYNADESVYNFAVYAKKQVRTGLEVYNRLNEAIALLIKNADIAGASTDDALETLEIRGYVQSITLLSQDEGAEITINQLQSVGVIKDGRLRLPSIPFNVGDTISITKKREGYVTHTEEFVLDEEWVELVLSPMEKTVRHEGMFIYTLGQFEGFGLGYRYHIEPRQFFVGGENYFFLQTGTSLDSHTVIHDDIRALVGVYLLAAPGVPFRIEISAGVGCIFTILSVPPNPLFVDLYVNLLNICVEFRIWEITLFVREEMKLGLGLFNNLLGFNFFFINGSIPIFSFGVKTTF